MKRDRSATGALAGRRAWATRERLSAKVDASFQEKSDIGRLQGLWPESGHGRPAKGVLVNLKQASSVKRDRSATGALAGKRAWATRERLSGKFEASFKCEAISVGYRGSGRKAGMGDPRKVVW